MSNTNTGGPAFPSGLIDPSTPEDAVQSLHNGMTLRDYFAAKAMHIAWEAYDKGYTGEPEDVTNSVTKHAYQIADAMLKARQA
jgi:hypothetical protein